MKPRFLFAALALAYASHTSTTFAQAFLADPRLVEGNGIKAGSFELHPGLAAEGGYDSNYFQGAGIEHGVTALTPSGAQVNVNEPIIDTWRLRITPSFSLASRGARRTKEESEGGRTWPDLVLTAHAAAAYSALWANDSQWSSEVTKQDDVAITSGAMLRIFPARLWGGDLSIDYNRLIEASNDPTLSNAWKRDNIRAGGGITFRPGGGLFLARLGYLADVTFFESDLFTNLNNVRHTLQLDTSWRFLPRTALLYRGNISWLNYTNNAPTTLADGQTFDSEVGFNGLVSNYFGLLGMVGWAGSFFTPKSGNPQNYDSVVGQAEVDWYPHPQSERTDPTDLTPSVKTAPVGLSNIALGYRRSFGPSYLGTYFQRDRGYLSTVLFVGPFMVFLQGGLSHVTRPPTWFDNMNQQAPQSEENRVDAVAFVEYRVGPTVGINATFRYDAELNHRVYQLGVNSPLGDDLFFNRYQAYLGVRWFL